MSVDREKLRKFFANNGVSEAGVAERMGVLEPFFRWAEIRRPDPAAWSDLHEVAQTIETATGQPVVRVKLVSISSPWPRPDWLAESEYRAWADAQLKDVLPLAFDETLTDVLAAEYVKLVPTNRVGIVAHRLAAFEALHAGFWNELSPHVWDCYAFGLHENALLFCEHAARGPVADKGPAARLASLLRLQAKHPIVGRRGGVWIALCA